MGLRKRIAAAFPWLQMEQGGVFDRPVGPHSMPMWYVAVPLTSYVKGIVLMLDCGRDCNFGRPETAEKVDEILDWLSAEKTGLSILVHPNTTDGSLADHTTHAIWIGAPVAIKMYGRNIMHGDADMLREIRGGLTCQPNIWGDSHTIMTAASD